MRFVGIVASGLVSGCYYNGGGVIDIDALKTSLYEIQFAPHRENTLLVVKPAVCHRSIYLLWDGE